MVEIIIYKISIVNSWRYHSVAVEDDENRSLSFWIFIFQINALYDYDGNGDANEIFQS